MAVYRITVHVKDEAAARQLVALGYAVQNHSLRPTGDGFTVILITTEDGIRVLQERGHRVERHEDLAENHRLRNQEVGQGNRYRRQ